MAVIAVPGADVQPKARPRAPFDYQPPLTNFADKLIVPLLGGDGYEYSVAHLVVGPVADPAASLDNARVRLARAGWELRPVDEDPYGRRFIARTATTVISLSIATQVGTEGLLAGRFDPTIEVRVGNRPPDVMRAPVLLGWLVGAAVGWMAAVITIRLFGDGVGAGGRATNPLALSILSMLLATPVALAGIIVEASYVLGVQPSALDPVAPWLPYMLLYLRTPGLLGMVLFCVAGASLLFRGRSKP